MAAERGGLHKGAPCGLKGATGRPRAPPLVVAPLPRWQRGREAVGRAEPVDGGEVGGQREVLLHVRCQNQLNDLGMCVCVCVCVLACAYVCLHGKMCASMCACVPGHARMHVTSPPHARTILRRRSKSGLDRFSRKLRSGCLSSLKAAATWWFSCGACECRVL